MGDMEGNMLPVTMDSNSYINSQSLLPSNNSVNPYLSLNTNSIPAMQNGLILSQVTDRQYNDPEAQESRHIWDEIAHESIEKQKNTLVGRLAEFMRSQNRPVAVAECADYIQSCYDTLRKSDGNKYKGDSTKAIYGALHSTGVFKHTEDDKWELCEAKIEEYEEKLRRKFESKSAKKHELQDSNFHRPRKKYTRRSGKREEIVRLLGTISNGYHDGSTTNSVYFRNPFKGCEESEEKIRNRLGEEKFTFLLQVYNYFEDLLNKGIQINTERVTRNKNSRELSDLSKQAEGLQHIVEDLKNRVNELEKASDQNGII